MKNIHLFFSQLADHKIRQSVQGNWVVFVDSRILIILLTGVSAGPQGKHARVLQERQGIHGKILT